MRFFACLGAALASAIVCGPATAVLCELTLVSIFYGSVYESTVAWSAVYIAGPIGLLAGFVLGAWLTFRATTGNKHRNTTVMKEAFIHE